MKYRPEYDMKVIGENLRRLREEKSLSVDEVREYLRLGSVQAVYKYERGKSYPQADTMFALMELYEASLSDITCKHENHVYSFSKEGHEPSFCFIWILLVDACKYVTVLKALTRQLIELCVQ